MSDEVIKQAEDKILPFIEKFISKKLEKGLQYLVVARNDDGSWGRLKGGIGDIRTTALALKVFVKNHSYLKYGEVANSEHYLRNLIPNETSLSGSNGTGQAPKTTIEEVAIILGVLSLCEGSNTSSLLRGACKYLVKHQNEDGGWGEGTSRVDLTATCILALGLIEGMESLIAPIKKGKVFLESTISPEGGWGVAKDSPTSVIHSAKATLALCLINKSNPLVKKAANFLLSQQNNQDGYWGQEDQSDIIFATGLTLKALVCALNDKNSSYVAKAVDFLFRHQQSDGGWGWKLNSASEVEPTAVVIDGLFDSGVNEYISVSTAIDLIKGQFQETVEIQKQNELIKKDIESQVQQRISSIIENQTRLEQRVSELDNQNKKLQQENKDISRYREELNELRNLRLQHAQVRNLLDQANSVLMGKTVSFEAILDELESTIARNNLHVSPVKSDIIQMLRDKTRHDTNLFEDYSREYKRSISFFSSEDLAQKIVNYVSALPSSPIVNYRITELINKIETETIRSRPTRKKVKTLTSSLSNFEKKITKLAERNKDAAVDLVELLLNNFEFIHEKEYNDFLDYVKKKFLKNSSLNEQKSISVTINDILRLKDEDTVRTHSNLLRILESLRYFAGK